MTIEHRDHMVALARRGGRRSVEVTRQRKAQLAAAVVTATADDARALLRRRADEVDASSEHPSVKARASAKLVAVLVTLEGATALVRENERLRAELTQRDTDIGGQAVANRTAGDGSDTP